MFRRSSAGATDGKAQDSEAAQSEEAQAKTRPAAEAGKGRPTPKRREAERNRYQSITGGTSGGRGGSRGTPADKNADRTERARRYEAMKRGEDWALGPRDRGPTRKFARDWVDTHRRPSNYMMIILVVLIFGVSILTKAVGPSVSYIVYGALVLLIVDAYSLSQTVKKQAAARFPNESTRGIAMYAGTRALQFRFLRFPRPRLKPGDKI